MADLPLTFSAVSIPTGSGGIDATVYEDVGADGSGSNTDPNGKAYDNSATTSLSDGTTDYTLAGFDASSGNEVWFELDAGPPTDRTVAASVTVPVQIGSTTSSSGSAIVTSGGTITTTSGVIDTK